MTNKRKILLMTKLAMYEKKYGEKDKKAAQFYQSDYVYLKNVPTRIAAGIGGAIVIALMWVHRIIVEGVDVLSINYQQELIKAGVIIVVILVIYTFIGTIKSSIAYNKANKRLNKYWGQLNQLEQIKNQERDAKEAANLDGADVYYPRRYN